MGWKDRPPQPADEMRYLWHAPPASDSRNPTGAPGPAFCAEADKTMKQNETSNANDPLVRIETRATPKLSDSFSSNLWIPVNESALIRVAKHMASNQTVKMRKEYVIQSSQ